MGRPEAIAMPAALSDPAPSDHITELLLALLADPQLSHGAALGALNPAARGHMVALARAQRVLPPLVQALEEAGLPPLPEAGLDRRAAMVRALALQAEALRLHQMLQAAGIAHRFLKGVVLAGQVYPALWARPMRDIDILLHPEDLPRAHALLAAQGGVIARYAHKSTAPTAEAKHLPPLWSPQRLIGVELHGQAIGPGCGLDVTARARLDAALWQGDGGTDRLPAPEPAAMLVHLVVHAVHDHELNNGPILICDMRHLLERGRPDPSQVAAWADQLAIAPALALALSLLPPAQVARAGLAPMLRPELRVPAQMARALLFQDPGQRNELRLAADLAQKGAGARLGLILRRLVPDRARMLDRWQMEGHTPPPPPLPVFWLWFLRQRGQQMRARDQGVAGRDPRDHLLGLRALRDETR